jgi:hypothetical protein
VSDQTELEAAMAARLTAELEGHAPPAGWQGGVWTRLHRRRARRVWWWTGLSLAVATALVLFLVLPRSGGPIAQRPVLAVRSERSEGGPVMRGDFSAGDRIVIEVRPLTASAQLRIYGGDGSLRMACDRVAPCQRSKDGLTATVVGLARGEYRILVVRAVGGVPPSGHYDQDTAALIDAGGEILSSRSIEIR